MRIVKNNKRISVLGLIKFFTAIAIVYFHTLPTDPSTHWSHLWLLVELFFFITGYFTFKHFRKKENRGNTFAFKFKGARNQIDEFVGKILESYNSVFTVKQIGKITRVKSYSYNDVLIDNLEIKEIVMKK